MQKIIDGYQAIEQILYDERVEKCMVVHGYSFTQQEVYRQIRDKASTLRVEWVDFTEFTANPKITEVQLGVERFLQEKCDFILAAGGGSAIDVAKCIKQKVNATGDASYVKMLAMPTTAGTGSESTQFAVIYEEGEKKSVEDAAILPDYVILEASLLKGLPMYQRKATMLDALCQAIESIWARRATPESRELAQKAIRSILTCYQGYLNDVAEDNRKMLHAANLAGQAINVTRTTAAHAMSYKITSLFGAAHGHAVGACMKAVWGEMLRHPVQSEELRQALDAITDAFGAEDWQAAYHKYVKLYDALELHIEGQATKEQMDMLVDSVNVQRLSNHPVELTKDDLRDIYKQIIVA